MNFTIDQAGKIEDANEDTVLAMCSNKIQYAILVPKRIKQDIFGMCKRKYKNNLTFGIFAHSLSLLIKD